MTAAECRACQTGRGHIADIDPDKWPSSYCEIRCVECKKDLSFRSTSEVECCGHRYVGEDRDSENEYRGEYDDYSEDFDWEEE